MSSVYSLSDSFKRKRDRKRKLKNSIIRLVTFSLTVIVVYVLLGDTLIGLFK